jgi:hypothetical protein
MFPTLDQVIQTIPNVDSYYSVYFDDHYQETNEYHVQKLWGPVTLLTTDLAMKKLPLNTPIVFVWGDFHCYDGHYERKSDLLSVIEITSFQKVQGNYMEMTVRVLEGLYKGVENIHFSANDYDSDINMTYGTCSLPVYVYL